MAATHTPGPFTVGELVNLTIRIEEPERTAALVLVEPGRTAQAEATARLIAAAPDLLAALRDFEVVECEDCGGSGQSARDGQSACRDCGGRGKQVHGGDPYAVLAAIASAEGRS